MLVHTLPVSLFVFLFPLVFVLFLFSSLSVGYLNSFYESVLFIISL